jgi:hypothetical protein
MTRVRSCLKTRCMSVPRRLFEQQPAVNHSEKCSNFGFGQRAFRSLSQPEAGFRQIVWQCDALNRMPKNIWLSGISR